MIALPLVALVLHGLSVNAAVSARPLADAPAVAPAPFVVAIAQDAAGDPAWSEVAAALVAKHGGASAVPVITFDAAHPETLISPLTPLAPKALAVVVRPEAAGRAFVGGLHRAMRKLDEDPGADVRWGIITSRTAAGAKALAAHSAPLVLRNALGTADFPMQLFSKSVWWSEEAAWKFTLHESGVANRALDETTVASAVADAINRAPVDIVMTGGHATERGLELGFRKPAGSVRPKDGAIVVEARDRTLLPVTNRSPKVWIGVGNCLIGNVNGPDSMAATLVEDFGVRAHVGYVVVTWFGRGGWGTLKQFTDSPGERTLNEAWAMNNEAMISELGTRWPQLADLKLADATFDGWLEDRPEQFASAVAKAVGDRVKPEELQELTGLLWDRDAITYIGDPTWDVRVQRSVDGQRESH